MTAFAVFVTELADESPEFRPMWERKRLALPPVKRKIFKHASVRPDAVADDVTLVLYVPVAESFDVIRRLVSESVE